MKYKEQEKIIVWLDNCGAQNKNWALMTFLVFIVNSPMTSMKEIYFKYFTSGHTYMSADSFHHQVELRIKANGTVNDYYEFISYVQSAKSGQVEVKDMQFSNFFAWKDYQSAAKLKRNTGFRFKNMVVIRAERGAQMLFYKSTHDSSEEF